MTVANATNLWQQLMSHEMFNKQFTAYNKTLNNALIQLAEQPQDIQGRDAEIDMLYGVLERPKTPVALLLGQAGVGKTALVEEFAKQLNSGRKRTNLRYKYVMVSLRLGVLASLGVHDLQSRLASLLDVLKQFQILAQNVLKDRSIQFVLFIDEMHMLVTIFGPGTKVGGDVIKDVLARAPIRVIAATTKKEYDSTIAVDAPLKERFKVIEMAELPPNIVENICYNWWEKVAPDCPPPTRAILRRVIKANAMYRSDSAEPRKTIDILEDFVSHCRRTGLAVTDKVVERIFEQRYSINLSFKADPDKVYQNLERRVKGQPFALYTLKRALRSLVFQLDPISNKPMLTMLFTGPTGVGKTESVKAIAEALYPDKNVLLNINMPDFKTAEHDPAFRKRLGEFIRHTPNAIVLLDEFEKCHPSVLDSMLAILDEGIVNFEAENREGAKEVYSVSLRNSIIIATTNAGHKVYSNDARFSARSARGDSQMSDTLKSEVDQLLKQLIPHLQAEGFKPEMLGRFNRVIPYMSLGPEALLTIAENEIQRMLNSFKDLKGITVLTNSPRQWDPAAYNYVTTDLALYITFIRAKAADSNSGGARAIKREIESNIYDSLVDCISDNPSCHTFKIEVSKDTKIYTHESLTTEGGIVVEPIE